MSFGVPRSAFGIFDNWGRQPALPNLPVAGFFFPAWQVFPALPDMPPKYQWQVFGRFSIF